MKSLHPADLAILLAYGVLVVAVGLWAQRRQRGGDDYYLGGRGLPWPLVGVSILATAFSATSLLGGPGEAFTHGLLWVQLQIGDLLGVLAVVWLMIPALRSRNLTTAYEYLEQRFDRRVRVLASVLFQLQVVLRAGVLVYGPALALSTLTGISLETTIVTVGLLATFYTVLGGITAVVWTDALQLGVIAAGLVGCLAAAANGLPGGLGQAWALASEAGRTQWIDPEMAATSVRSLPGAVVGYGILALAVAGTNQQSVQRYLSCRSVSDARRAALLGWAVGALVTLATLAVGVVLFGFYRVHAGELPEGLAPDAILPHFVATRLAPGVAGLLMAAILAAAMSSLDSALSSLATATSVDLLGAAADGRHEVRRARGITLIWGVIAIAAALALAGRGKLLELGVQVMGWFAGPVLALFLLALLPKRVRAGAALLGGAAGLASVVFLAAPGPWPAPSVGIWLTAIGALVSLVTAAVTQWAWSRAH